MTEMTKMTTPIRSMNLIENTKIRFFTKRVAKQTEDQESEER